MRFRKWLPAALAVGVLLAGCAGQEGPSSNNATDDPAIAKAKADEAKARAAEAKSMAEEAAARAEKAKADAKRARSEAAGAGKSSSGSSGSAAGSSYSSPSIWISCGLPTTSSTIYFSGDWQFSTSTARLFIDYGDGRHYTTSHIPYFRSAYRHTYHQIGDFLVTIQLTDGRGNTATDSCEAGYYPD